jgi:hypothetical protein
MPVPRNRRRSRAGVALWLGVALSLGVALWLGVASWVVTSALVVSRAVTLPNAGLAFAVSGVARVCGVGIFFAMSILRAQTVTLR